MPAPEMVAGPDSLRRHSSPVGHDRFLGEDEQRLLNWAIRLQVSLATGAVPPHHPPTGMAAPSGLHRRAAVSVLLYMCAAGSAAGVEGRWHNTSSVWRLWPCVAHASACACASWLCVPVPAMLCMCRLLLVGAKQPLTPIISTGVLEGGSCVANASFQRLRYFNSSWRCDWA